MKTNIKKSKMPITTLLITRTIVLLIANSTNAKEGAVKGMELCTAVIIPSLLPILILTNILTKSRCSLFIETIFGKITEHIFHLPKESSTALIFGLTGGYPNGAILTEQLYEDGYISRETAIRMMRFDFCGGIAFVINAIGTGLLKSVKTGILLYIAVLVPSIITGIVQGLFSKEKQYISHTESARLGITDALVESVEICTKSILLMCCYIIFFSALCNIIAIPDFVKPLMEITNGIFCSEHNISFSAMAMFIEFGGFCIHFQLMGIMNKLDMAYYDFALNRILSSIMAYGTGKIIEIIFPQEVQVFSNMSNITPKLNQVNNGLSVVLLIGCVVLVLDLKSKKQAIAFE